MVEAGKEEDATDVYSKETHMNIRLARALRFVCINGEQLKRYEAVHLNNSQCHFEHEDKHKSGAYCVVQYF